MRRCARSRALHPACICVLLPVGASQDAPRSWLCPARVGFSPPVCQRCGFRRAGHLKLAGLFCPEPQNQADTYTCALLFHFTTRAGEYEGNYFFQTNKVFLRQAFDTLCPGCVFLPLLMARGKRSRLTTRAWLLRLCVLAWWRALRCELFLGGALGPAFLLALAAVFALWGGVSGGATGHATLPRAGQSPLLAAR